MTSVEACRMYKQYLQVGVIGEGERWKRARRRVVTDAAERTRMSRSLIDDRRAQRSHLDSEPNLAHGKKICYKYRNQEGIQST